MVRSGLWFLLRPLQRGHPVCDPGLFPAVQAIGLEYARSDAGRRLRHVPGALSDRAVAAILAVRLPSAGHRQSGDRVRTDRRFELGCNGRAAQDSRRDARALIVLASERVGTKRRPMTGSAKQSIIATNWIASSRSLSSGAHSRDPLAPRNDVEKASLRHLAAHIGR